MALVYNYVSVIIKKNTSMVIIIYFISSDTCQRLCYNLLWAMLFFDITLIITTYQYIVKIKEMESEAPNNVPLLIFFRMVTIVISMLSSANGMTMKQASFANSTYFTTQMMILLRCMILSSAKFSWGELKSLESPLRASTLVPHWTYWVD